MRRPVGSRRMWIPGACLLAALAVAEGRGQEADFVGPADFAGYLNALEPGDAPPAVDAGFRDLWERPGDFAGRRVRVAGRVERRFRQPAHGAFPALTEAWIVDPAGNPLCLVFPSVPGAGEPGRDVAFEGTFLRRIRYAGADAERLAPLIVGPDPPAESPAPGPPAEPVGLPDASGLDPWIAGALAALVIVLLGLQHLRRRPASSPLLSGPPPEFVPGPDDSGSDER